ncbi:MAG: PQQ-dependent sugar dehydrogenase [Acidimicrobiia bacterium]
MLALVAGSAFCGGPASSAPGPVSPPVAVRLVKVADLDQPLAMATRPGDPTLFVAERGGRVRRVRPDGRVFDDPVLDLSDEVSRGGEQGLVGLAFAPGGDLLYVGFTDLEGDSRIVEFAFDGRRVKPGSRRQLLFVDQPHEWHNNGQVIFGPDGLLYLGLGDGGPVRLSEHRAQDLGNLFGKVLRIDPRPGGGAPYRIPDDNPFVDHDGARPEIWMYGLRQPWRFTFDRLTGDFWVGDVGELEVEEIDFLAAGRSGANFGWDSFEGSRPLWGPSPKVHVLPVLEYEHGDSACAVMGGYVYRGRRIPGLDGAYVFGDLCGTRLSAFRTDEGSEPEPFDLGVEVERVMSFGEDAEGELYVMSQTDGLFRLEPARPGLR